MVGFEYLAADIGCLYFQFYVIVVETLFCHFFQFIESVFTVAGFVTACLRHPAHPVEFRTVKVVGTFYFYAFSFDTFLAFLEVIAVTTFILVDLLIVYFDDFRADTVEEVAVMSHHQQAEVGTAQVVFEPFGHIKIEVVGGLIENQEFRFGNQGVG